MRNNNSSHRLGSTSHLVSPILDRPPRVWNNPQTVIIIYYCVIITSTILLYCYITILLDCYAAICLYKDSPHPLTDVMKIIGEFSSTCVIIILPTVWGLQLKSDVMTQSRGNSLAYASHLVSPIWFYFCTVWLYYHTVIIIYCYVRLLSAGPLGGTRLRREVL